MAGLTTVYFHPSDLFSNTPIYSDDYSLHLTNCMAAKRFMAESGKCWGYDPFLLAGFPRCALVNADNKAWELVYFLFEPLIGSGHAFKLYVLFFLLFFPFFVYGAARNFNLSAGVGLSAAVLSILYFYLSMPHDLVWWGMISYVFVSFFSFYVFSCFYKLFEQFTWKRYLAVLILASLLFLSHILSPMHIFVPAVVLYLCNVKRLSPTKHGLLIIMLCGVVLLNGYWLINILKFYHYKTVRPENYDFTLQITSAFEAVRVYLMQMRSVPHNVPVLNNTFVEALLLVLSSYGFFIWAKTRQKALLLSFLAGLVFIFGVAYFGSHLAFFSQFQPERFTIPLNLFLVFPAAIGLERVLREIFSRRSPVAICLIIALGFVLLYRPVIRPFGIIYKNNLYRLMCRQPEPLKELLAFIQQHTTREGRILVEDSESSKQEMEAYYGTHFPGLFPEYVRREYLCGPRPIYPIMHSYASFTDGLLFERDIQTYTLSEMKELFARYNVKWVISWNEESLRVFDQHPQYLKKMVTIDKFVVYEVMREPSYFLQGSGTVTADYNRFELQDLKAEDGAVIISYHWMEYLRADPEVNIEKAVIGDDPIGFIKIVQPPESLVIYNAYK